MHGHQVPLLASGPGAAAIAGLLRPLGAPVEVLDGPPGAAMGRKLLRSVFMKGLASVVCEAVAAGRGRVTRGGSAPRSPGSSRATGRRSSTGS
jgi:hypothetical protein